MPVWLITGCTTGIGREIALSALKKGDVVLATCRKDPNRLSDLEKLGALPLELDISESSETARAFVKKILDLPQVKSNGGVDYLVNNAGYVQVGAVEEVSEEEYTKSFNTNFFGHLWLTQALLPQFRKRRSGTIAFIGTRGAYMNIPGITAYTCAKYALSGLAESLAIELETFNIRVTCIEPGDFRTSVFKSHNFQTEPHNTIKEYDGTAVGMVKNALKDYEQPHDPIKGGQRIADLVSGDLPEALKGKKLPARIALGDDAHETVNFRYRYRLEENEVWKEWCCGLTFDDEAERSKSQMIGHGGRI